jgi:ATP-binding cassette subfamily B protein
MKYRSNSYIHTIKKLLSLKDIKRTFIYLKPFLLKQKKIYVTLVILLLLDIFLTIAFAWFYGTITDAAIQSNFERIKELIPVGVGLLLLGIASTYLSVLFETMASQGIKQELKDHLYHHISRMPAERTSDHRTGELLSYFSNDLHSVDALTGSSLLSLIRLPVIYISVFIFLIQINFTLSLISLAIAPLALISGLILGFLLRDNGRKIHCLVGDINSFQNDSFLGLSVVRAFTLENLFFKKYKNKNKCLYDLECQNAKLQGVFYSGGQFVSSITFLVSLCLGAYFVSNSVMTIGALIMFINLVNHLVYPLTGLASQWTGFQRAVAALERVLKVLDEPTETETLATFTQPRDLYHSIILKDVTFKYSGNKNIFENLKLEIPVGETIAIVGPSGAGKSTLFNLLQKTYEPQTGEIYFDGTPSSAIPLCELRSMIAYVPQETYLFTGTIRDNLLMAKPNLTELAIIQAAKNACIHEFIIGLPSGYDTEIGERGFKLSGGQKQRLAIARALLKDAPIILLDEATSALDSETETKVKIALERLMKEKTTLIVAHRLSTIQDADMILVLDQGKIVQQGSHKELLQIDGLYKRLYETSSKENLKPIALAAE